MALIDTIVDTWAYVHCKRSDIPRRHVFQTRRCDGQCRMESSPTDWKVFSSDWHGNVNYSPRISTWIAKFHYKGESRQGPPRIATFYRDDGVSDILGNDVYTGVVQGNDHCVIIHIRSTKEQIWKERARTPQPTTGLQAGSATISPPSQPPHVEVGFATMPSPVEQTDQEAELQDRSSATIPPPCQPPDLQDLGSATLSPLSQPPALQDPGYTISPQPPSQFRPPWHRPHYHPPHPPAVTRVGTMTPAEERRLLGELGVDGNNVILYMDTRSRTHWV